MTATPSTSSTPTTSYRSTSITTNFSREDKVRDLDKYQVGDKVKAGTSIAIVGNTGDLSTGTHLHFELWHKGEAVDPTRYIKF